jgi:tetratricopeptide (TPR) repeat protein
MEETPIASPPSPESAPRSGVRRLLPWIVLGVVAALALAGFAGYRTGERQRENARQQAILTQADEQFQLGLEDLEASRYELARQRFEYVIRLDPIYPEAPEKLAAALVGLKAPIVPQVLPTATPNLAPVAELFDQAKASFDTGDWSATIDTLITLRGKDSTYRAIEVDGMLYAALRNRGVDQISNKGLLEEGIYDLNRAELFGPLDQDADNWRSWADLYLLANSYIGANWAQAAYYFAQVYVVAPYMRNDAYIKYAQSAQAYGDQLVAAGDACAAKALYEESLLAMPNEDLEATATKAVDKCEDQEKADRPKKPTKTPGGEATEPPATEPPATDPPGG